MRHSLNENLSNLESSENRLAILTIMVKIAKTLNGILETSIHQDCAENISEMTLLARKVTQSLLIMKIKGLKNSLCHCRH